MSVLFCGQTDSGKSSLCGRILYDTHYFNTLSEEDQKMYRKYLENIDTSPSKSKYSVLMDLIDGELLTGKTKTVEFGVYKTQGVTIIDTPGHKMYIRSLISGLFDIGVDWVCLVISAIGKEFEESFEKGTVKEDLLLARATGCKNLILAWNKVDVEVPTEEMRKELIRYAKRLSYQKIEQLDVSALAGINHMAILDIVRNGVVTKDSQPIQNEEVKNTCVVKAIFVLPPEVLISKGYECVMHSLKGEVEIEVTGIKDARFICCKNTEMCIIRIKAKNQRVCLGSVKDRVIFRSGEITLGFGNIEKA